MTLPEYSDSNGKAGFNLQMGKPRITLHLFLALCPLAFGPAIAQGQWPAGTRAASTQAVRAREAELLALTNQARAAAGVGPVKWDSELAAAALNHCLRMAAEGSISHRFGGEPDVTRRAALAGAHFSLIAENVALGPYAAGIQQEWLNSPGHRANIMQPRFTKVGVGFYRTADGQYWVTEMFLRDRP